MERMVQMGDVLGNHELVDDDDGEDSWAVYIRVALSSVDVAR